MGKVRMKQVTPVIDEGRLKLVALDTEGRIWYSHNRHGSWTSVELPDEPAPESVKLDFSLPTGETIGEVEEI